MARKQGAKMVDIKFVDTFGTWQHFSVPVSELTEDVFADGFGFDGSSIRGWKSIEASDMLAMPDPETAFIDPFCSVPTLSLTTTIAETGTKEAYNRDPRGIAQRGEKYLESTGVADSAVFGPEAEFFIFDNAVRRQVQRHLLPGRFRGSGLEHRKGRTSEPRIQNPPQGRLLPRRAQ
jgi:glutamine synthetase